MNSDPYRCLISTVIIIQKGDRTARDKLVEEYKPFIWKTANQLCKRMLEWGRDDELSIGLIAFNSAIDTFDPEKQIPFLAYCRIVIQNRLKDHFRKESKHLNLYPLDDESGASALEGRTAWEHYVNMTIEDERREELGRFESLLSDYAISLEDLVEASPKHRDYRLTLFKVASLLLEAHSMMEYLSTRKQLPLNELEKVSGINRKTLEKGRKFIIASALVLNELNDFLYLRSYINFGI